MIPIPEGDGSFIGTLMQSDHTTILLRNSNAERPYDNPPYNPMSILTSSILSFKLTDSCKDQMAQLHSKVEATKSLVQALKYEVEGQAVPH